MNSQKDLQSCNYDDVGYLHKLYAIEVQGKRHCIHILCQLRSQDDSTKHTLIICGTQVRVHKMAVTSFAITLYDQCCRRHLVGQRVVRDTSVVRSCCVPNLILLICFGTTPTHCCTWDVYFDSHTKRNLTYKMTTCNW